MQNGGKLYYTISEVATMFQVKASKLRFYEDEFPTLKPKKGSSGARVYTQADIDHIREILELVETKGFKLPAAREYLQRRNTRWDTHRQYIANLENIKALLVMIRNELDAPPVPEAPEPSNPPTAP